MWKVTLGLLVLGTLLFAIVYKENFDSKEDVYSASAKSIQGGEFTLNGERGPVSLSDFKGKTVVMYFGFTACPDVCPMALSYLNGVLKDVEERDKVKVLFVSVDHKRDSPETVGKYVRFFNKDFIGLTGSQEQINKAVKKYNVYYRFIEMKNSGLNYTVDHTSRFFIVGPDGSLQKTIHSHEPSEVFKKQLLSVLE